MAFISIERLLKISVQQLKLGKFNCLNMKIKIDYKCKREVLSMNNNQYFSAHPIFCSTNHGGLYK